MRFAAFLLSAAFLLAGCSDSGSGTDDDADDGATVTPPPPAPGASGPETHMVSLENTAFVPAEINITVGDTVHWMHNDGNTPHNVESGDPAFDSDPNCTAAVPVAAVCMVDGEEFQWTFDEVQDVTYLCEIHNGMTGTIHVLPAMNGTA